MSRGATATTTEQIGGASLGTNEATIENGVMTETATTTVTTTKSFVSRIPNPVRSTSASNLAQRGSSASRLLTQSGIPTIASSNNIGYQAAASARHTQVKAKRLGINPMPKQPGLH